MFRDRWTIEISAFGRAVASTEVSSVEDAFDLAEQCRPVCLKPSVQPS